MMNPKLEKPQPVVDRKTVDKWLATLIEELKRNHKDKVDLLLNLYPPNFDENSAVYGHLHFCPVLNTSNTNELRLHPPVAALLNAILNDPGNNIIASMGSAKGFDL